MKKRFTEINNLRNLQQIENDPHRSYRMGSKNKTRFYNFIFEAEFNREKGRSQSGVSLFKNNYGRYN